MFEALFASSLFSENGIGTFLFSKSYGPRGRFGQINLCFKVRSPKSNSIYELSVKSLTGVMALNLGRAVENIFCYLHAIT